MESYLMYFMLIDYMTNILLSITIIFIY